MLVSSAAPALAEPSGTRGQNYDTAVIENPTDGDIALIVKVRTLAVSPTATTSIVVTDNGRAAYGPESDAADRFTRPVTLTGKGRHEVTVECKPSGARPVYCTLEQAAN